MSKRYAVIDVETTGGRAARDRITEIAIVLHDGSRIINAWESLVNPECRIPQAITELTGITQEMVADAPKFYEVARTIVELTEGAVFVAHNARFDYSFICEEFSRLGYAFTRKQLCTLRLSRQLFPGLPSYSLGKLAGSLGIDLRNRHRAMGDAYATAEILGLILDQDASRETIDLLINLGIRESRLPQNLNLEKIHALPEACGVYYFHDERGNVVYVGKSINIQKRVAEHFADRSEKAKVLQQSVHDISFEITGSELVALLLESHEIKRLSPPVNRAQRQRQFPWVVHSWTSPEGYLCFGVQKVTAKDRKKLQIVSEYPQVAHARAHLRSIRERYELCGRLTSEESSRGPCFYYHLHQCHGACLGLEAPEAYNERAIEAGGLLSTLFDQDFFILEPGREREEYAVILVECGQYQGYGYLEKDDLNGDTEVLRNAIKSYPGNPETNRIIHRHLRQNERTRIIPVK